MASIIKKYDEFLNEDDTMEKTKEGKLLFQMEKDKSPQHIEVRLDYDMDDMIMIMFKDKKGELKGKHLITPSSFEHWLHTLQNDRGFHISVVAPDGARNIQKLCKGVDVKQFEKK